MQIDLKQLVTTSFFRAHAAELFDAVAAGTMYVITRSGRPIAVVKPIDDSPAPPPTAAELHPSPSISSPSPVTPIDLD